MISCNINLLCVMYMEKMESSSLDTNCLNEGQADYRLYKRRYFLLATLSMLNLSNAMVGFIFLILIIIN